MSTIVQKTALTIVCGLERNFRMEEREKMTFAVVMLRELLQEQGLELGPDQLQKQIEWAYRKRRLQKYCPYAPLVIGLQRIWVTLVGSPNTVMI